MSDQLAVFVDFENVALWAEREFFDFEITSLLEYLQTRGPVVVKRAYADWSRFSRYREELMKNSIDLIQIYSVRQGKNRADIRMAIDAFETALTRSQISTYVIVSGDSDFGPLVSKLREYGRYTIGVGPRSISPDLLVRSCDEFIYLEAALGEPAVIADTSGPERDEARSLLVKALQAHGQRGELPILATRLKQTMLMMDPTFNEANFGYTQFKNWLEDNRDLVKLYLRELQLYAAPIDAIVGEELNLLPVEPEKVKVDAAPPARIGAEQQYRQIFSRMKMNTTDFSTRRDVLRDIYRELVEHPGGYTTDDLLEMLRERYEMQGFTRSKALLRDVLQMAFRQRAFDYHNQPVSLFTPVWLAAGIESEAEFVSRAETDFLYAVIKSGLDLDYPELACNLLNDRSQVDYVQFLLDDLKNRGLIARKGKKYVLSGQGAIPFQGEPALQILIRDIEETKIPDNIQVSSETAHMLAKKAMVQRSQDFAASGQTYLLACRLQWDAVEKGEAGATLDDLRWFMASYASAVAGKLSQVNRDYAQARPYYLAFFALVKEDDPLWSRMRGLINPMLSYYWANAARELELNVSAWNQSMSSPAQIAIYAATHPNADLRRMWQKITEELAEVNPALLHRIANQIQLNRSEDPEYLRVGEQIERILIAAAID
ncbi:MAG: NYN domain-containing protein [Anaerolineales bacterium]|nr:NYN domain-containing protein [Anaerolineales bacterium]